MRALPPSLWSHLDAAHLPPRPHALHRLLHALGEMPMHVESVAAIVACDAGLTFRVAAAANAPTSRTETPRTDLAACVAALGQRLIRTLATSLSVRAMFDLPSSGGTLNLDDFTAHALLVAELADTLAVESRYPRRADARLAGLLHDTGVLAGIQALGSPYARAVSHCRDEAALAAREVHAFAIDHAEIGAWLADQCDFSGETGDAILFHHAGVDEIGTAGTLPQLLWLAHAVASGRLARQAEALYGLWRRLAGPECEPDLERLLARARRAVVLATERAGVALTTDGQQHDAADVLPRWSMVPPVSTDASARAVDLAVGEQALAHAMQDEWADLPDAAALRTRLGQSAHILFGLAPVVVLLLTADGHGLSAPTDAPLPAPLRRRHWSLGDDTGWVARAARDGRLRSSFDGGDPGSDDPALVKALGAGGLLALPLTAGSDRPVGVLLGGLTRARHDALVPRHASLLRFAALAGRSLAAIARREAQTRARQRAEAGRFDQLADLLGEAAGAPLGTARDCLARLEHDLAGDRAAGAALAGVRGELERVAAIVDRMRSLPGPEND